MRALLLAVLVAAPALARAPSVPVADTPQLAALGPDAVGLAQASVAVPGRARTIALLVWYPAAATARPPETYRRHLEPAGAPLDISTEGIAVAAASPLPGRFPLVVISHGFGGWAGGMTYLAENLASKGYVVAAIDHADGQGGSGGAAGRVRVAVSLGNRARDQQAVLAALAARAADPRDALGRHIDATRIGLIGYSLGGFGALATAGAPYDAASPVVAPLGGALADQTVRSAVAGLRAVVAFAPWGGTLPNRAWTAAALAGIAVPSLFVAGDRDDVSGYAGIRWLYDNALRSDRWLLTYAHARHNVAGNPPPPETRDRPDLAENFAEPVWRADRLNAINQHFVTAFLDRFVKGDAVHGAFLDVPTEDSDAAVWPDADRGFATAAQVHYWPGFQRRWLLGLTLRHDGPSAFFDQSAPARAPARPPDRIVSGVAGRGRGPVPTLFDRKTR